MKMDENAGQDTRYKKAAQRSDLEICLGVSGVWVHVLTVQEQREIM